MALSVKVETEVEVHSPVQSQSASSVLLLPLITSSPCGCYRMKPKAPNSCTILNLLLGLGGRERKLSIKFLFVQRILQWNQINGFSCTVSISAKRDRQTDREMASAVGKVETDVHIKASAEQFHDVFCNRTHHIANVSPGKIQSVDIYEGEWGTEGSIIFWNYVHDGKACVAKELVEAIDPEKNKIVFKVIEGDLLDHYKSFRFILEVTPAANQNGSVVHWIMEYEKLKDHIPDPHTMLQLAVDVSKDIDAHLSESK